LSWSARGGHARAPDAAAISLSERSNDRRTEAFIPGAARGQTGSPRALVARPLALKGVPMKRTSLRRRAQLRAKRNYEEPSRSSEVQRWRPPTPSAPRPPDAHASCAVPTKRIDPAHLIPRSLGGCGDRLCVVPVCRWLWLGWRGSVWWRAPRGRWRRLRSCTWLAPRLNSQVPGHRGRA
jgi:hypothetical protein